MLKVHAKKLGNVAVLCLRGRITTGETSGLRQTVNEQTGASAVVLDLARVSSIDAHGLGVLLELRKQTEAKGIEFRLTNVTKLVRRVLEITRLDSVFEVTSEAEAVGRTAVGRRTPLAPLASCA